MTAWHDKSLTLLVGGSAAAGGFAADHSDHDQFSLTQELWHRKDTLLLPMSGERAMIDADGRLALITPDQVRAAFSDVGVDHLKLLYLGRATATEGLPDDGISVVGGQDPHPKTIATASQADPQADPQNIFVQGTPAPEAPILALVLAEADTDRFSLGEWRGLREIATRLNVLDVGLLTRAIALANWHRAHAYSPSSGRKLEAAKGGWVLVDAADASEHFPRTDPAIIVAVTDRDDRLLLASNVQWNEKVYSLIAGFVDPGESLEQAVEREVWEEARVRVSAPKYLGSQPWPFPASLMLGFTARASEAQHQMPDGVEIRSLRWFSRAELGAAIKNGEVIVPGKVSISRAIIEAWYGEPLPAKNS